MIDGDADGVRRVAERVRAAAPRLGGVRLVAVDGPSGAGKSTFADALVAELAADGTTVRLVRTDDFATWDEPVEWWPRLVEGVLEPLRGNRRGRYRRVEWPDGRPVLGAVVEVDVPEVLVVEGVSSARRVVSDSLSVVVWIEGPDATLRLQRAVAREGEANREHLRRWQEFECAWFVEDDTPARADISVQPADRTKSS